MFSNYFKIAFRNLWRNKSLSTIHILGLSLGIATCLLIVLYIQHELSFDRYNEKADRIYRVTFRGLMQGGELKEANVMPPVAGTFKMNFPEIEETVRLRQVGRPRVSVGDQVFKDDEMAFADPTIFRVFTLPLIKGMPDEVLKQPNTIVITPRQAMKYFGTLDVIGKTLNFKDFQTVFTITGLVKEMPSTSHFHFDLIASMAGLDEARSDSWMTSDFFTYLLLKKGASASQLQTRMPGIVEQYVAPQLEKAMGISFAEFKQKGNKLGFVLQPITDIHLHSDLTGDFEGYGDIQYVYIFGAVAVFMLLIACINFMNLSTAGASKRAKEIGIRKVMGSLKKQLIVQFLTESFMITTLALVLAVALVYCALPAFNRLTGQDLGQSLWSNPWTLISLLLFGLLTGLLAGSYPAFYLSSFKPIAVLKGKLASGGRSSGLRSGLVVFQFFISIGLMVGTIVVWQQLSFIRHKKLGYDKDRVLVVQDTYWLGNNQEAFRAELLRDPRVISVSRSGYLPAGPSNNNNFFIYPDDHSTSLVKTIRYDVDDQYIPTLGMKMLSGRNFSRDFGSDSTGALLNETAAKLLGWTGAVEGHTISSRDNNGKVSTYRVIGVVNDFHFRSLHQAITPLVMIAGTDNGTMIVKISGSDPAGVLNAIRNKWNDMKAESPFSYSFLDQRFEATYKSEQNIAKILALFAGLTIFVACLGLFGLATFTAERRTREIGIRKVLGADVTSIIRLLSVEFVKLVCIAFVIAAPVAWFVMNRWLQDFAYRISIPVWVFAVAAFAAIFTTLVTVSFQSVRVALLNPVKSLKAE